MSLQEIRPSGFSVDIGQFNELKSKGIISVLPSRVTSLSKQIKVADVVDYKIKFSANGPVAHVTKTEGKIKLCFDGDVWSDDFDAI